MAYFWTCPHGRVIAFDDDEEPECGCSPTEATEEPHPDNCECRDCLIDERWAANFRAMHGPERD